MGLLDSVTVHTGTRLGPYEITGSLGAGGMGEVYRARDPRLGRDVAIKVLPATLSADAERLQRFEQEACAAAALNHPNILAVHDIGTHDGAPYIVSELLEGQTLRERMSGGALPVRKAIEYAVHIAHGLAAAHEKGIVHRDLKPENVFVTADGRVKILDFGLAKLTQAEATGASASVLPTTPPHTLPGIVLGTIGYMTGKQAFDGETVTDVFVAVLKGEPDWNALPQSTPGVLRQLLRRCLQKDPRRRLQHIGEARIALEEIIPAVPAAPVSTPALPVPETARRPTPWMLSTALLFVAVIGLAATVILLHRSAEERRVVQFFVPAPEKEVYAEGASANFTLPSLSPDGRRMAFTTRDASGKVSLWIRSLDTLTPQRLAGTDGASRPFWSPDSRSIAFFAEGKLKKIDASGGPPQKLCDGMQGRGGTWNRDGVILFALQNGPIFRVASAGGEPVAATRIGEFEFAHRAPSFLPDGKHFLYLALDNGTSDRAGRIARGLYVGALGSTDSKRVLTADTGAIYSPSGELLFVRQDILLRQSFDDKTLEIRGDPTPVDEQIAAAGNQGAFSVSDNGVLAYKKGAYGDAQLTWVDRSGKILETVGQPGAYRGIDVSREGQRIAVHRHDGNGGDIWIYESSQGPMRFTFDATRDNSNPVWSPDGKHLIFASRRNGKWGIYRKLSDHTGGEEQLYESGYLTIPMSWSPDGQSIVFFLNDPKTGGDQWILPLNGDKKPIPLIHTAANEDVSQVSPDQKWIAYRSNETNRQEVYVGPFPSGEGKRQVSLNGGSLPRWRRDGKELFYNQLGKVYSVKVDTTGSTVDFGTSTELFDLGDILTNHTGPFFNYAVSPDGQRFLIPRAVASEDPASTAITVIFNWTASLRH